MLKGQGPKNRAERRRLGHNYGQAEAGEENVLRKVYHPFTDEEGDWRENHGRNTRSSGW